MSSLFTKIACLTAAMLIIVLARMRVSLCFDSIVRLLPIWTIIVYNKLSSDSSSSLLPVSLVIHLYYILPFSPPLFSVYQFGLSLLIRLSAHLNSWITVLSLSLSSFLHVSRSICPLGWLLLDFHKLFKRLFSQTHTWPHCSLIVCPCFGDTHLSTCAHTFHSAVFTQLIWSSQ